MTQPNTNPATDLDAMLERLANINPDEMTDEQRLTLDRFAVARNSAMGSDRRSDVNKLKLAEDVAKLNAKGIKFFKAVDQFYLDTGDTTSIRLTVHRKKDITSGKWVYYFTHKPSAAGDEVWLPGGKDLIFTFKGQRFVNTYIVNGETKTSRGSKTACESLCKAIGKNTSGSTASTSIKRELAKTDSDGNPGGTSQFRTQLEDCWIQHPSINDGKAQKLTEYFLALDEPTDEEEGDAEDESGS